MGKSLSQKTKKNYALADAMHCVRTCFAWTDAKLCVSGCKALRGHMQCFALADAMLCV